MSASQLKCGAMVRCELRWAMSDGRDQLDGVHRFWSGCIDCLLSWPRGCGTRRERSGGSTEGTCRAARDAVLFTWATAAGALSYARVERRWSSGEDRHPRRV